MLICLSALLAVTLGGWKSFRVYVNKWQQFLQSNSAMFLHIGSCWLLWILLALHVPTSELWYIFAHSPLSPRFLSKQTNAGMGWCWTHFWMIVQITICSAVGLDFKLWGLPPPAVVLPSQIYRCSQTIYTASNLTGKGGYFPRILAAAHMQNYSTAGV